MLFTDTDSLTYEIKSEYVYEEFFKHKHLFDFSNFSKGSNFYDNQNEDEYRGIPINKFVGSQSKMHCILSESKTKNLTQQREWILHLSLMNTLALC